MLRRDDRGSFRRTDAAVLRAFWPADERDPDHDIFPDLRRFIVCDVKGEWEACGLEPLKFGNF